ncbi:MAG: response regulator [Muribaculaceae bacterium]|nr:response regulator [Muribaculaceae bacterium]
MGSAGEYIEEISEEIRKKITSGDYDLIFLDLRMTGVAEDSVMKPEEFSGMSILKAIKRINAGIQVIMLTATNKAWNLKALMDAGANGYYMKESPEYHFPLKYSEQNAVALIAVIKACIRNSYLQDIVDQQKKLILPPDSELSDHIYTQLSIAVSLILSARTESEYAFAYISLEQIFEIASSFLIRQVHNRDGDIYYFTEDAHEQCRLYQNGKPDGYLQSYGKNRAVAQWKKIAAIYHQLYGGTVKDFGEKVKKLINLRNEYIHPSKGMKPSITHDDFIDLFETILTFLSVFK